MRRLAYIMGPNYSGSTLLTMLLAEHPGIATVGELKATAMGNIAEYRCSCGELLTDCSFWHQVKLAMQEHGRHFTFNNFGTHFRSAEKPFTDRLLRASFRSMMFEVAREAGFLLATSARKTRREIIKQNKYLIEIICSLQHAETFLDDSKEPVRLKFLLAAGHWDIRIVQLIRDGRGVANSYMRHNRATMMRAAREWARSQQESDRMAKVLGPNRCLIIHYEDFCRAPEQNLSQIHHFLGLEAGAISPTYRMKHIMGNQMRLGPLQNIRLDEKWKERLGKEDSLIFDRIAGELNRMHGYR